MEALLEIRNLSYRHPDGTEALKNVSFQLQEGENLVLFGPNGSGKTTLLFHINGTLSGEGSIRVRNLEVTNKTLLEIRRRVGLVFQDADEQLFMPTVLEDVMFGALNIGLPREAAECRARQVLSKVGIPPDLFARPPYHLSAGEKRRVALAGVLVMDPQLLLLDEPTTSLDPPGQRALIHVLRSLPQAKVIATQDAAFARSLSRRAIFLENGRLVADGEVDRIVRDFRWSPYP